MKSLLARFSSRKGLAALLALALAAVTMVLGTRSSSAEELLVQYDLKVKCNSADYDGGTELRLYFGAPSNVAHQISISGVINDDVNLGTKSFILQGGDITRNFIGIYGEFRESQASLTGTFTWTVEVNTGTIEEPVWTPYPAANGSESYDCTPEPPPVETIELPATPRVVDDPNVDGDAHYALPGDTDVFDWTQNPDGSVTVVIVTNDTFPDGSNSHTYPAPVDVFNDADGDRVGDGVDRCQDTPRGTTVDEYGCSWEQRNDDGDDLVNGLDNCPTEAGPASNGGCPLPPVVSGDVTWEVPNGGLLLSCKNGNPAKVHFVLAPAGSKLTSVGPLSLGFKDGSLTTVASDWTKGADSFFATVPSGSTLTSVAVDATWTGQKAPKLVYASYSCGKKK